MKLQLFNSVGKFIKKNSSILLTSIGVVSIFTTAITAVKVTPEAHRRIEAKKEELEVDKLPTTDVVKEVWKLYIPSAASAIIGAACMIGSTSISVGRSAALATAAGIANNAYVDLKDQVKANVDDKTLGKIKDGVAKKNVDKTNIVEENIIPTGNGTDLCLDLLSGRLFYSNVAKLKESEAILMRRQMDDMFITMNDYYDELNLPHIDPRIGNELGWHIQDGAIEFDYSSQLTSDGKPCIVITTTVKPNAEYMYR